MSQEQKLQNLLNNISTNGIASLLTYGVPETAIIKIKKEGAQKGTNVYFYPYDTETEDIKIVIDNNLNQKLTELMLTIEKNIDKQKVKKLINVFTNGTKSLNETDCIECKFSGTTKGTHIQLSIEKTEINFILGNHVDVINLEADKKPTYKISKNLIPNSLLIKT